MAIEAELYRVIPNHSIRGFAVDAKLRGRPLRWSLICIGLQHRRRLVPDSNQQALEPLEA
jgi:hypothetical protein